MTNNSDYSMNTSTGAQPHCTCHYKNILSWNSPEGTTISGSHPTGVDYEPSAEMDSGVAVAK
jgi:hypothetical protein